MTVGAVWGSLSSTKKVLAVIFLLVNVLNLAAIAGTLGYIYTHTGLSSDETISCPAGWTLQDNYCYKVYTYETTESTTESSYRSTKEGFTFDEAICEDEEGAALVSIHSQAENQVVLELLTKGDGWLNAIQNSTDNNKWIWGDGTVWDYNHWAEGDPTEGNVYLKMAADGTWVTTGNVGTAYEYVCKKKPDITATTTAISTSPTDPTPSTDPTAAPTDPTAAPTDPTAAPTDPTAAPTDPTEAPTDQGPV